MKRFGFILSALFILPLGLAAQDFDYVYLETEDVLEETSFSAGGRFSVGIEKKIGRFTEFSWSEEARFGTRDELWGVQRIYSEAGISYAPLKNLKFALGYTHILKNDDASFVQRHRLSGSAAYTYKQGAFSLSLKESFQGTYNAYPVIVKTIPEMKPTDTRDNYNMTFKNPSTQYALKSKLKASYNLKHLGLKPFASYELRTQLNGFSFSDDLKSYSLDRIYCDRNRFEVGTAWKINKNNTLNFSILLDCANEVKYKFKQREYNTKKGEDHLAEYNAANGRNDRVIQVKRLSTITEPEYSLNFCIAYTFGL